RVLCRKLTEIYHHATFICCTSVPPLDYPDPIKSTCTSKYCYFWMFFKQGTCIPSSSNLRNISLLYHDNLYLWIGINHLLQTCYSLLLANRIFAACYNSNILFSLCIFDNSLTK